MIVMESRQRNYGIDVLRILAMLFVVMSHVVGAGLLSHCTIAPFTVKREMLAVLSAVYICAVNCYALISGYVGLHARHQNRSIIKLWFLVVVYNVASAVLVEGVHFLKDEPISVVSVLKAFLPLIYGEYWYFTAYFALFFFMPLLNEMVQTVSRKVLERTVIATLFLFSVFGEWFQIVRFGLFGGYSFLWLAILYVMGGYFRRYGVLDRISKRAALLGFLCCVCLLELSRFLIGGVSWLQTGTVTGEDKLFTYPGLLVVASAVFLVAFFSKLEVSKSVQKCVAILSSATFGVYIIHQTPAFCAAFFTGMFADMAAFSTPILLVLILGLTVGIFLVCAVIDFLRAKVFALCRIDRLAGWTETVFLFIGKQLAKCFPRAEAQEEKAEQEPSDLA